MELIQTARSVMRNPATTPVGLVLVGDWIRTSMYAVVLGGTNRGASKEPVGYMSLFVRASCTGLLVERLFDRPSRMLSNRVKVRVVPVAVLVCVFEFLQ